MVRYPGGYDSYRTLRDEAQAPASMPEKAAVKPAPAVAGPVETARKKLTHAERIELDGILDRIAGAEARVAELEAALSDPSAYNRGAEAMKRLRADYDASAAEVTRLVARWEALESRR